MTGKTPSKEKPSATARAEAERVARQAREAAALRENLRKRKQQMRAREKPDQTEGST
jgi:hypothetical protein